MILRLLLLASVALAHISLTYPPARYPPLDFLDNIRTQQPCGVPRPLVPRYTDLNIGETYNISWRMQYPHKGGFRLTLMDESGNFIQQILPTTEKSNFTDANNSLLFETQFRPSKSCEHCILRVEKQALEWGSSYEFYSCADINILTTEPSSDELCSGNGLYKDGECVCKHLYSGDLCQFKDDCSTDDDCLNGGSCVEQKNSLVHRVCYCAYGFYGTNCAQKMQAKPKGDLCFNYESPSNDSFSNYGLFNPDCYKNYTLNKDDKIYTRIIGNELELIMDYKSASWIAVGWRPLEISISCRLFPDLENIKWKRDTQQTSASESEEVLMDSSFFNETQSDKNEDTNRLRPVPQAQQPKSNGFIFTALVAKLHPMDCTDIITASIVDGKLRINDMYSRDRSTPLVDTWVEGEESLTAAYGIERDGRTVVMFRREISEIEPSDHPLGPGKIFVIYAKGGEPMMENMAEGDRSKANLQHFYHNDELNYHGSNRGSLTLEFVSNEEYQRPRFWSRIQYGEKPTKTSAEEKGIKPSNSTAYVAAEDVKDSTPFAHIPKEFEEVTVSEPSPEPEPEPEPNSQSTLKPALQSTVIAKTDMPMNHVLSNNGKQQPSLKSNLRLEPKAEPEPEPEPRPEPVPEPEPTPEPEPELNTQGAKGKINDKWESSKVGGIRVSAQPPELTSPPQNNFEGNEQSKHSSSESRDIKLLYTFTVFVTLLPLLLL